MTSIESSIDSFLDQQTSCLQKTSEQRKVIAKIIQILIQARDSRKKIFTMGPSAHGQSSTMDHLKDRTWPEVQPVRRWEDQAGADPMRFLIGCR